MHALGLDFGSAAQLSKRPGSVWTCLWGNALKRSPGIIRKSRVSYPGPGFLSSVAPRVMLRGFLRCDFHSLEDEESMECGAPPSAPSSPTPEHRGRALHRLLNLNGRKLINNHH